MTWRVAFTGHRPDKLGGYGESELGNKVRLAIREALATRLFRYGSELVAMSGMALGVDQWAAAACVELGIPFVAALPCWGQDKRWPEASRQRYAGLLSKAERVVLVTDGTYTPTCMHDRNKYMVEWCDELLAVWGGGPGGTENCVQYAHARGKPVVNIHTSWGHPAN